MGTRFPKTTKKKTMTIDTTVGNYIFFTVGVIFGYVLSANFKAEKVEDWKGRTVRTSRSPVAVETFKLLGAKPMEHIALEEMNEYADKGVITAGESTYVRIFPLDQYKSFEFVNDTAHSLFLTSIIVNQDFFAQFGQDVQEIMSTAAFNAARKERRESVESIPSVLAECEAQGVEVVKMDAQEEAKFREVTSKVYDLYANYFSKDLVKRIKLH